MKKRPIIILISLGTISVLLAVVLSVFVIQIVTKNNIAGLIEKSYQSKDFRTAYLVAVSGAFQYPGDTGFLDWIRKCEESLSTEENSTLKNMDSVMQEILEFEKKYPVNEFREQFKTIKKLVSTSNGPDKDKEIADQLEKLRQSVEKQEVRNIAERFDEQAEAIKKLNQKIEDLSHGISAIKSLSSVTSSTDNHKEPTSDKEAKYEYLAVPNTDEYVKQAVDAFYSVDYNRAQEACGKVLQLDKTNPVANLISGAILFIQSPGDAKTRKKIIRQMKAAIDRDPKLMLAYLYLGQVYEIEGLYAAAIQELKTYLSKEKDNDAAFFSLGRCYYQTENYPEAVTAFQTVLGLKPDNSESCFYLAQCYIKQNDPDAAIASIEKAIEIDPKYYQAMITGAELFEKKADWNKAIGLYKRAFELRSQAFIAFRIGVCAKKINQPETAVEYFKLSVEQDSSD
jgi:tetratricopeptide (TPR) repeat protein